MVYPILRISMLIGIGLIVGYLIAQSGFAPHRALVGDSARIYSTGARPGDVPDNAAPGSALPGGGDDSSGGGFSATLNAYLAIAGMAEDQLAGELRRVLEEKSAHGTMSAASLERAEILLSRHVELSPEQAIQFMLTVLQVDDAQHQRLVLLGMRGLARTRPELLVGVIKEFEDRGIQYSVTSDLLMNELISDVAGFQAALPEITANMGHLVRDIEARNLSPQESFAKAQELDSAQQQFGALMAAAVRWAQLDPEAALAAIQGLQNSQHKDGLIGRVLMQWARSDSDAALAAAQGLSHNRANYLVGVLGVMAEQDPRGALEMAEVLSAQYPGFPMISSVVNTWAQQAPREAAAYVQTLPSASRQQLIMNVANHFQRVDAREALLWALDMDLDAGPVVTMLGASYALTNPQGAVEIVESLAPGQVRDALLAAVVQARSQGSARQTLEWIERYAAEDIYASLQGVVLSQWAMQEPESAVRYVQQLDDSPQREQLSSQVVMSVVHRDTSLAEELIGGMQSGVERDRANAMLATRAGMTDLELALGVIDRIDNPDIAHQTRVQTVIQIMSMNPARADELIARFELEGDASIRQFLQNKRSFGVYPGMTYPAMQAIPLGSPSDRGILLNMRQR